MKLDAVTLNIASPIKDLRNRLQASTNGELFILKDNGDLFGTVTFGDLSETAFDNSVDDLINAGDVARQNPPVLTPEDDLETALILMNNTGEDQIAVVKQEGSSQFKGCVHQRDIMAAYNQALLEARHEEHNE